MCKAYFCSIILISLIFIDVYSLFLHKYYPYSHTLYFFPFFALAFLHMFLKFPVFCYLLYVPLQTYRFCALTSPLFTTGIPVN